MPTATQDLIPLMSPILEPRDQFQKLLKDIRIVLGRDNGITASDSVRLTLQNLLEEYESDEVAWQYSAFRDPAMTFTRNLVDRGNGNYNLVRIRPISMTKLEALTRGTNSLY